MSVQENIVAIVGGTLIDGNGGTPIENGTVVFKGNRITDVGSANTVAVPPGAQIIDAQGKTVLPGLIDSHVHIGTSGGGLVDPNEYKPDTRAANFKTFLIFGVTTIMDMAAQPFLDKLQADLSSNVIVGPRLFGVKYGVTAPDSHPMGLLRELRAVDKIGSHFIQVDDVESARMAVKRVAGDKAAGLKIYHSRTEFPGTMCLDCNREKLKLDVLKALVVEGHAAGLKVFAHIAYPSEAREVIEAGADVLTHPITHAESGAAEVIDLMVERGVQMHSTLSRIEAYFGLKVEPFLRDTLRGKVSDVVLNSLGMPNSVSRARHEGSGITEDARRILDISMANVRRANKAGATIIMGTDSGGPGGLHGASVPREMELLNLSGLTPMEVIVASTKSAATVIGQGEMLGTLETGKLADILIIAGNPLRNISNIRNIECVVKDGQIFDSTKLTLNQPG